MSIFLSEILLLTALYFDIRYLKVPNAVNAIFMVIGIILNTYTKTLTASLLGGLFCFICFFSVYTLVKKETFISGQQQTLRILGAGDCKLIIAIGLIMGFKFSILACTGVSIAWILVIAPILYWKGSLLKILKQTFLELKHRLIMLVIGKKVVVEAPDITASIKIPFVTVIFVGVNLAVVYEYILK